MALKSLFVPPSLNCLFAAVSLASSPSSRLISQEDCYQKISTNVIFIRITRRGIILLLRSALLALRSLRRIILWISRHRLPQVCGLCRLRPEQFGCDQYSCCIRVSSRVVLNALISPIADEDSCPRKASTGSQKPKSLFGNLMKHYRLHLMWYSCFSAYIRWSIGQ
jgi:hypothetical protein